MPCFILYRNDAVDISMTHDYKMNHPRSMNTVSVRTAPDDTRERVQVRTRGRV